MPFGWLYCCCHGRWFDEEVLYLPARRIRSAERAVAGGELTDGSFDRSACGGLWLGNRRKRDAVPLQPARRPLPALSYFEFVMGLAIWICEGRAIFAAPEGT